MMCDQYVYVADHTDRESLACHSDADIVTNHRWAHGDAWSAFAPFRLRETLA